MRFVSKKQELITPQYI